MFPGGALPEDPGAGEATGCNYQPPQAAIRRQQGANLRGELLVN